MFFRYVMRSVWARKGSNLITIASLAGVLGGCMLMVTFVNTLTQVLDITGRPENVIVLGRGAPTESSSGLTKDQVAQLQVLPGIRQSDGHPLASAELVATTVVDVGTAYDRFQVRGVDAVAYEVHPQVHTIEGRAPAPHASELMIGREVLARHPELAIGSLLPVGEERWPIVGIFSADGGVFEAEVWGDRAQLVALLKSRAYSSMSLVAQDVSQVPQLVETIRGQRTLKLSPLREREYYLNSVGNLPKILRAVVMVMVVMLLGALLAATNSLQASLLGRLSEFATLKVLGFRRGRLGWLVLEESLLLALVATAIGAAVVTFAPLKVSGLGTFLTMPIRTSVSGISLAEGAALGLVIGLAGGLLPALMVRRLDALRAL